MRTVRGVMSGIYDNNLGGPTVYRTLPDLGPTGKLNSSGMVTVPLSTGDVVISSGPSEAPNPNEDGNQQKGETKEAAKQTPPLNPLIPLAGLAILLL